MQPQAAFENSLDVWGNYSPEQMNAFARQPQRGAPVTLVVQGAQGTGKTGLCLALANKLGLRYGCDVDFWWADRVALPARGWVLYHNWPGEDDQLEGLRIITVDEAKAMLTDVKTSN